MKKSLAVLTTAVGLVLVSGSASAIPMLQLDIAGGSYDSGTDTVITTSNTFTLYAYLTPGNGNNCNAACRAQNYYISAAIIPQTSTLGGDYGSFTFNTGGADTTVNATSDMIYGVPPADLGGLATQDPKDLGTHSIYPTYFYETQFVFNPLNTAAMQNVEDNAGNGPSAGKGMLYQAFNFDLSNLMSGYNLHFDLYSEKLCTSTRNPCDSIGDIDIKEFAPFSHDAESRRTQVPEPITLALFGAGLAGMGLIRRRKRSS